MNGMAAAAIAQGITHYALHLLAPGLIAWFFFRPQWKRAWRLMVLTMLVDLDHLFAYPEVFAADRCSIGLHPLHSSWATAAYFALLLHPRTRVLGVGLLFHMLTDLQDCAWSAYLRAG